MHNSHTPNITSLLAIDKFFSKVAIPSKRHSLSLQLQELSPSLLPEPESTAPDQSCPSSLCVQNLQFHSNWIQLAAGTLSWLKTQPSLVFPSVSLLVICSVAPPCPGTRLLSGWASQLLPKYPRLTGRLDVHPPQLPQNSWLSPLTIQELLSHPEKPPEDLHVGQYTLGAPPPPPA